MSKNLKVLIPPLVDCALIIDEAVKQGAWPGARYVGRERNSLAWDFPIEQAKALLEECEERTAPSVRGEGWDIESASEKAAFKRLAKRLRAQLAAAAL